MTPRDNEYIRNELIVADSTKVSNESLTITTDYEVPPPDPPSELSQAPPSPVEPDDLVPPCSPLEPANRVQEGVVFSPRPDLKTARQPLIICEAPKFRNPSLTSVTIQSADVHGHMKNQPSSHFQETLDRIHQLKWAIEQQRSDIFDLKHQVFDMIAETLDTAINRYHQSLEEENTFLRDRLREETVARRKLHNTIQELKGNIRVYVRMRPLLPSEAARGFFTALEVTSETALVINRGEQKREFAFDRVFSQSTSNSDLFTELQQLLVSSMDGFNVAILAYGITGSGKTFTMEGIYERIGIDLFEIKSVREATSGWRYSYRISIYEVYNETIIDLLNLKNIDTGLRTNPSTGFFYLPGITSVSVHNPVDIQKALHEARQNRSVSSTDCNEQSSRSHQITSVCMEIQTPFGKQLSSKITLVDLAGSERLSKSGAIGAIAKEGMHINKSLAALGDVINARASRLSHVPYRNSVLTSALQDCIAGESKTLMILQVNPSNESVDETYNSLTFAARIREVETQKPQNSPRKRN